MAAEAYGAAPGADPAVNTQAIQRALSEAGAQGGGIVTLTTAGTFDLAVQGPNRYFHGNQFCLDVDADGVTLRLAPDVVLRLADGQQTDAAGPVDVVILTGARNVAVDGGGTIRGNTAGQRGWS